MHLVRAGAGARAGREEVRQDVRAGAHRQGDGICRGRRRHHAAPVADAEASACRRARHDRLRAAREAYGVPAGRHGRRRHQGRSAHPGATVRDLRAARGAPRGGDLRACGPQVQSGFAEAAGRAAVRPAQVARRPQDQDRAVGDAGQPARRSGRKRGFARKRAQSHQHDA